MVDEQASATSALSPPRPPPPPPRPPPPATSTSSTPTPPQRKKKRWFPLESNPAVMQKYVQSLGLLLTFYTFNDVLSTEDWALDMVLPPVLAVLFLFPIKPSVETFRREEDARIKAEGQVLSPQLFFTKQTVGNACGTVGLLHAMLNNKDKLDFAPGSFLEKFEESTRGKTAEERAVMLEEDEGLDTAHESAAAEGQSNQVPEEEEVNTHFITFVEKEGSLYELDGRKNFPINHGPSSPDTLLRDAAAVVRQVIARDPEELRFTVVVLSAAAEDDE